MKILTQLLPTELDTMQFAAKLAGAMPTGAVIYLQGSLGAGKTTFTRGFLRELGYDGIVKSPTYTLVEPYDVADRLVFHFDLYRLADPKELEYLGVRDYFTLNAICLIEWPDKGLPLLPSPDLICHLTFVDDAREMRIEATSARGEAILDGMI